jgi:hypothetical protein
MNSDASGLQKSQLEVCVCCYIDQIFLGVRTLLRWIKVFQGLGSYVLSTLFVYMCRWLSWRSKPLINRTSIYGLKIILKIWKCWPNHLTCKGCINFSKFICMQNWLKRHAFYFFRHNITVHMDAVLCLVEKTRVLFFRDVHCTYTLTSWI